MPFNCQKRKVNNLFFSHDSLTIYDGGSITSPMMGKYCGDSIPPSHISSSNDVLIHFQSDSSSTKAGFQMEYQPIGKQKNTDYHIDHGPSIGSCIDRCRILGSLYSFCRKVVKIFLSTL